MQRQNVFRFHVNSAARNMRKMNILARQVAATATNLEKRFSLGRFLVSIFVLAYSIGNTSVVMAQSEAGRFLVLLYEKQTDISPRGLNLANCAIILPDGRFHLERRVQQLPRSSATLTIFESSLDSAQVQQLRTILDKAEIRQLTVYAQPQLPIGAPWTRAFNARIVRATGVQNVGYWTWRGGSPEAPPNSETESVKKAWQQSENALRPLADWLHGIEGLRMIPSDAKSTLCTADASADRQ